MAKASALGAGNRGFESHYPDFEKKECVMNDPLDGKGIPSLEKLLEVLNNRIDRSLEISRQLGDAADRLLGEEETKSGPTRSGDSDGSGVVVVPGYISRLSGAIDRLENANNRLQHISSRFSATV